MPARTLAILVALLVVTVVPVRLLWRLHQAAHNPRSLAVCAARAPVSRLRRKYVEAARSAVQDEAGDPARSDDALPTPTPTVFRRLLGTLAGAIRLPVCRPVAVVLAALPPPRAALLCKLVI
jgi:hypothetical protein